MLVIGIDEVGRGSLIGDVFVCATMHYQNKIEGVKDSKSLSSKQRQIIFEKVQDSMTPFAISYGTQDEIDKYNVLVATMRAMERVASCIVGRLIATLSPQLKRYIADIKQNECKEFIPSNDREGTVDFFGNWSLSHTAQPKKEFTPLQKTELCNAQQKLFEKDIPERFNSDDIFFMIDGNHKFYGPLNNIANVVPVIKGDSKIYEIALASICAKEMRDKFILTTLHEAHPEYQWGQNFGYGTKNHIAAIKKLGQTSFHRKSFKVKLDKSC